MNTSRAQKVVSVIAYSGLPLVGVIAFGWSWQELLILYWLVGISMGITTVIDMIRMPSEMFRTPPETIKKNAVVVSPEVAKPTLIIFYLILHSMFVLVSGGAILAVAGSSLMLDAADYSRIIGLWLVVTVIQILMKVVRDYIATESVTDVWVNFLGRFVVLQFALIVGAAIIITNGLPSFTAIALILLNFLFEFIKIHLPKTPLIPDKN